MMFLIFVVPTADGLHNVWFIYIPPFVVSDVRRQGQAYRLDPDE
jgi:hypothetical protein